MKSHFHELASAELDEAIAYYDAKFPFDLFYVIGDADILILAIAHESRRPGYWRSRL